MIPQRGLPPRNPTAPSRRAHTEPARAGHVRHARPALSEFWNAWSACLLPILVEPHGSCDSKLDVKYFRPRPKTPSMSYVVGRHDVAASRYDRPERRRMDGEATHRVSLIRSLAGLPINGQLQLVL